MAEPLTEGFDDPEFSALLTKLGEADSIQSILEVVCRSTGMGFAAVAHVSESRWIACQVRDEIAFGLKAGGELPVKTTLCDTVRGTRQTIVIDDVASDPIYRDHHTPATYGLQSYIAVPIILEDGEIFGTLCAIDPKPRRVNTPETLGMFNLFAELIGTRVGFLRAASAKDVLERKVAVVEDQRKVYSDIVESSTASVTALDLDFRVLAINRANADAFKRVYGVSPKPGDYFLGLFGDNKDHIEQQRTIWARALSGEEFFVVGEFGDSEFERRHYEVRFSPLLNRAGELIGASSTSYDVTDRVRTEAQLELAQEQLRQSQKMEALGQLTGGVAHDFNNLLTPILGVLEMLQRRAIGGEREQRLIGGARQAADRARTLIQRLLAFARRQPLQPTSVDVGQMAKSLEQLIASTVGPQVQVIIEAGEDLPFAYADRGQLEMALINLCVNARDAMPDGGSLRISVMEQTIGSGHRTGLAPGAYVQLAVADTGSGMDEATMARAIEPFFSTKGIGKGTGLGLSMVDGLARQLGGTLTLKSKIGSGTQIELWLPISVADVEIATPSTQKSETRREDGIVLLIDDEALVRMATADMLDELGYTVVEASSAEAALRQLRSGLRPDIVVTDHVMPGMTGADLVRLLATEFPGMPALIVSGYSGAEGLLGDVALLKKPFHREELSARLTALGRTTH